MHYIIRFSFLLSLSLLLHVQCTKSDSNIGRVIEDLGCNPASKSEYILPYPVGKSYKLVQGNCGNLNHQNAARYAFDFAMPFGSPIIAARAGVVNFVEESFTDGDNDAQSANLILILHDDQTLGRYQHLSNNGALVEVGNAVQIGDTIALSGNTGFVTEPQLHFDVLDCSTAGCTNSTTVPVGFINAEPPVKEEGVSYLAKPF